MQRSRALILFGILVLITVVPALIKFYTDWIWFAQVGYLEVFRRSITARLALGSIAFVLAFGVLAANFYLAQGALRRREFRIMGEAGPRIVSVDLTRIKAFVYLGAGVLAFLIALYASSQWETWLLWRHAVPFGSTDPILGNDTAFYIFQLPFYQFVQGLALVTVLLAAAGVAGAHGASGNLSFDAARGVVATRIVTRHLSVLGALVLLLLAVGTYLRIPELLTTDSGTVFGASYADVHARMPALRLLIAACLIGAALALFQVRLQRLWPAAGAAGLYLAVAFGGAAYSAVIQRFVVAPNEQVRETPYIIHNIAMTRDAFGLDGVVERPLSGEARLTLDDLENNRATLDNVPLWNDQPLLDTFGQIQEIRTYYDFVSVDNDRYTIDGEYRQIMLSARELNSESLPSRSWINERLTFTHGYGLTLGPVNEVTPEGLPVLFIKDLPPKSVVGLEITQPAVYYGELSSDHVFVNTKTEEFDYPEGEDNKFTRYEGDGGVVLGGLFRRLMFAIRFRSLDTLFSPNLTPETRVMLYRRISERVRRIAPFLNYDPDPYLAISGGGLVWIQDAYTTSGSYPYSTPAANDLNYIRNSVKVTINAYDGRTTFHLLDPDDPIAATLDRVFPGLFTPLGEMADDLRTRLRYPPGIFEIQAAMFSTFHMTNPAVFYNREDQWDIPSIDDGRESRRMEPYYTIMKLPGESGAEYIQMLPFTPHQKENLAAWMVARSDGENYGQLAAFQFPKQTVVFGPNQIAARMNQDQDIAPQITLWNQQGSEVIQGNLLVIPIEESLIYIRPLYLRAAGGRIPEMKRVMVAYRNQIVMEESLDQALERLFPSDGRALVAAPEEFRPDLGTADGTDLAGEAQLHYQRAIRAQREGDWARYGEEFERLGQILERLGSQPTD
ncbi:MAG: UPF0182 family protein [Deltaproteobacteria bacterium]|nr:MAG: UPF0182 family protein [Deltaproteobacteria bacterium]